MHIQFKNAKQVFSKIRMLFKIFQFETLYAKVSKNYVDVLKKLYSLEKYNLFRIILPIGKDFLDDMNSKY